jgi:hypothetical protein
MLQLPIQFHCSSELFHAIQSYEGKGTLISKPIRLVTNPKSKSIEVFFYIIGLVNICPYIVGRKFFETWKKIKLS